MCRGRSQHWLFLVALDILVEKELVAIENGVGKVFYPGEIEWSTRKDNLEHGIPVVDEVWNKVRSL